MEGEGHQQEMRELRGLCRSDKVKRNGQVMDMVKGDVREAMKRHWYISLEAFACPFRKGEQCGYVDYALGCAEKTCPLKVTE